MSAPRREQVMAAALAANVKRESRSSAVSVARPSGDSRPCSASHVSSAAWTPWVYAAALLLFLLALPPFGFFVAPLLAHFSRRHEFEADAYACRQAAAGDLKGALLKLFEDNASTLTPDPMYVRFYYSHPPASERLAALPSAAR